MASTNADFYYDEEYDYEYYYVVSEPVVVGSVLGCCILLAVVGNAIVILSFIKTKGLRNFSDYLILNLALIDFFIASFVMPPYVQFVITGSWWLGVEVCYIWVILEWSLPMGSAFNVVIISFDRYLQICHPFWSLSHRSLKMLAVFLTVPWVIPLLFYAPPTLLWQHINDQVKIWQDYECHLPFETHLTLRLIGVLIEFLLPLVAMTFFNISVYISIKRRHQQFKGVDTFSPSDARPPQNNVSNTILASKSKVNKDSKAATRLFIFVFVFNLFWLPNEIISIFTDIFCYDCVNKIVFEISLWALWMHSAINPILYAILLTRYRRAFKAVFCTACKK